MATVASPLRSPKAVTHALGDATCVVTAGPWFSSVSGHAFAAAAREAQEAGAHEIVLDLTTVRAVDASGTRAVALLAEELAALGCELALASTHSGLVAWIGAMPVDAALPIHDTVAGALADVLRRPL